MPSLSALTLRLPCDQATRNAVVDKIANRPPSTWRGNRIVIRCALFDGGNGEGQFIDDIANIVSATLIIRANNAAGAVLFTQTVEAAEMNDALTFAQWQANTGWHFQFVLDTTDSNFAAGKIYYAIAVATTDAGDITVATGTGDHLEDGIGDPGEPDTPDYVSWSKAESDARYLRISQELGELALDPEVAAAARGNLGIGAGALINKVAVPGSFTAAGKPGDFAHDHATAAIWIYTGDGSTHTWLKLSGVNA